MALELAIICAVAGAVLGLRYNVLVLVPAVTFAMVFAVIVGIARADSFWSIVLMTAVLGAAIQLGYLAGIAIYAMIESIYEALRKGRDHELCAALGPAWPPTWRAHSLQPHRSAIVRPRQPRPPQV
jgi:hypothetical protein